MQIFKMNGYNIHVTIKVPHLYERVSTYSYQFLIINQEGKIMNYPFSTIIAHNDEEFKLELKKYFEKYINYTEVKVYPKSKFLEIVANNSF
ncbi:MAG: hypothetical protein ACFFBC_14915 [Promethearchaeota archaeon]